MSALFTPMPLGLITLSNRVLMAPMTRNRAAPNGTPHSSTVEYYCQRASAGLIISEATQINAMGRGYINTPGIHTQQHIDAWKRVTESVHKQGGKIFLQLFHGGRISHTSLLPEGQSPVAPSAIRANAQTFTENGLTDVSAPQELTLAEIEQVIEDHRNAASNAKQAGFDGVEIHAANGYLIDQFLQDNTNNRQDAYGGSADNRSRLLLQITEAIADIWSASCVGVRLSPTGTFNDMGDSNRIDTFGTAIEKLDSLNLAYLHIVEQFPDIQTSDDDYRVISSLRQKWNGIYIANGGFDKDSAERYINEGKADAIAFGRPFIANPDLPKRLEIGAELNNYDPTTFYGGDHQGYTDYPFLSDKNPL